MAYTTIDDPSAHFQTLTYRGNSTSTTTSDRSLTNEGNSDLQPDLVWIANRDTAVNSGMRWWDSTRGVGQNLGLSSASTSSQGSPNDPEYGYVNSLNTNGFGVRAGSNDSNGRWTVDRGEGGGDKYVAWQWKANGGTTSSNSDGTITTTIQTNSDAGFSICRHDGNGTAGATFGHGLGVKPSFIISKRTDSITNWRCYHSSLGATQHILLNTTGAAVTATDTWNNTEPTSSVVTVGNSSRTNASGSPILFYVFAEKQGYSKFGKYTGNANANGPFIYTGFKPALIIIKNASVLTHWAIVDSKRIGYNDDNYRLYPNLTNAENTADTNLDILSNGFKIRTSDSDFNNGANIIYAAFAENPFVTSTGIPTTAR